MSRPHYEYDRNETMSSVLFATCIMMVEMAALRLRDPTYCLHAATEFGGRTF